MLPAGLFIAGNMTLSDSELTFGNTLATDLTNLTRRLTGHSAWVVNGTFGYDSPNARHSAYLNYNAFGERIFYAGTGGNEDAFEQPFDSLGIVYKFFPSDRLQFQVELDNILDEERVFEQISSSGQTALVVYSANAFTVTPLTTDADTVAALVNSLSTDIMPSRGSYPAAAIDKGRELLQQAGVVAQEVSGAVRVTEIEYIQADESFEVEVQLADGSEAKVFLDRQFKVVAQDGEWRDGARSITTDVLEQAAAAALVHAGGGRVVGIEASEELGAYEVDIMLGGAVVEVYLDDAFTVLEQR